MPRLDREQLAAAGMVDLERRVGDPEALAKDVLELAADGVAVVARSTRSQPDPACASSTWAAAPGR